MPRRRTQLKAYLSAVLVVPVLAACSSGRPEPSINSKTLSQQEVSEAAAVARQQIAKAGALVYSVTATVGRGRIKSSNTGHPCSSGRLLTIKLIGGFPHTVTTGHPVLPGHPMPDFTVRAEVINADARTGNACLIGVQTAEAGEPRPLRHAVNLCGATVGGLPCLRRAKTFV